MSFIFHKIKWIKSDICIHLTSQHLFATKPKAHEKEDGIKPDS